MFFFQLSSSSRSCIICISPAANCCYGNAGLHVQLQTLEIKDGEKNDDLQVITPSEIHI